MEVLLIRHRHSLARELLNQWISAAQGAPHWPRWLNPFGDERYQDEQFREKQLIGVWLPPAIFLPILGLAMLLGAIEKFLGMAS